VPPCSADERATRPLGADVKPDLIGPQPVKRHGRQIAATGLEGSFWGDRGQQPLSRVLEAEGEGERGDSLPAGIGVGTGGTRAATIADQHGLRRAVFDLHQAAGVHRTGRSDLGEDADDDISVDGDFAKIKTYLIYPPGPGGWARVSGPVVAGVHRWRYDEERHQRDERNCDQAGHDFEKSARR
jgi:hypothetical protein